MPSQRGRRARIARREELYWVDDDDEEFERSYKEFVMAQVIQVKAVAAEEGGMRRTESQQESAGNAPHRYVASYDTAQSGGIVAQGATAKDGAIVAILGSNGGNTALPRNSVAGFFGGTTTTLGRAIRALSTSEFPNLSLSTVSPLLAAIDGWQDSDLISARRDIRWEPTLIAVGIATRGSSDSPVAGSGRLYIASRVVTGGVSLSSLKGNESVTFDFGVAARAGGSIGNVSLSGYEETFTDDLWGDMDVNNNSHLANNESHAFSEGWNSSTWSAEMHDARPDRLYNTWQPKNSIIKFDLTDY